ncbi:MAG: helix-turn-helix transcriptional regulator [Actinobacteria bacterium]|nr:helix-turn-helix transcriptional regulator [Actinomycetota bacterium]MBI3688040.1 helix-turn-helix transcriptional regulator [Actinomycetota bacterium]
MRLSNPRDVGYYVRDQRREQGMTQSDLCAAAEVSRRWLSDLESGKQTAEIGLVFKVLHALRLTLVANPTTYGPDDLDLDEYLRRFDHNDAGDADHA